MNYGSDPVSPSTTYVRADLKTFRAVVQKLTGAPENPSAQKLPLTLPNRYTNPKPATTAEMGTRRPAFKLHERRHAAKKLKLNLNTTTTTTTTSPSLSCGTNGRHRSGVGFVGFGSHEMAVMVSPVSTLDFLARGSPITRVSPCEEEDRAIADKGYYLHPSPLSTPRGSDPPELLPLFPLHSPGDSQNSSTTYSN